MRLITMQMLASAGVFALLAFSGTVRAQTKPKTAQPPGPPGVKTSGVKVPVQALKPEASYDVPGTPDWLAVAADAVWVSNKPKNSVSKLDPKFDKVVATVTVGGKPCSGLATGFGSLWVPNCGDQSVSRVDLQSAKVTATFPIGIANSEGCIATGAGSFWILTDAKGTLARVDPADNKTVAEIIVPVGSFCVQFGEDSVWVSSTSGNSLTRVDPNTNLVVETIPVGKGPRFFTIGEGSVWTLNQVDGTVSRIDAKTNKVAATIEAGLPGEGGDIAFGEGSVWVTLFGAPVTRIDPSTNKVVQQFMGEGGDAIRAGLGFVWLSNLKAANVWRIDPKRIEATVAPN